MAKRISDGPIGKDRFYMRCLDMASRSKGKMRFGALVVKNGRVIGKGWNRRVERSDGPVRQGYCLHAEVVAINDALNRGHNLKGASVYVAGKFDTGLAYIPRSPHFSCNRCPSVFIRYGIAGVATPQPGGWYFFTSTEALECGRRWFSEKKSREKIGLNFSEVKRALAA